MKAVTDVGAPWYTSGVHMWNGTAASLKPKPTASNTTATLNRGLPAPWPAIAAAIADSLVLPASP